MLPFLAFFTVGFLDVPDDLLPSIGNDLLSAADAVARCIFSEFLDVKLDVSLAPGQSF